MSTLSRLYLNPQKRGGRKLLTNPQAMHAAVRAGFPPDIELDSARVLWRVDVDGPAHTLYIVGPEAPDLGHVIDQAGWTTRPAEVADLGPFLDSLRQGQEWAFRLVANPVRSLATQRGTRGKVVPHVTVAQQTQWLRSKAPENGFEILKHPSGESDVAVTHREDLTFAKSNSSDGEGPDARTARRQVTVRTARFDGSLRVTDAEAIRHALTHGIGRARAYGCGLLSLAKLPR